MNQAYRVKQLQEHGPFDVIGDVHGCYDELLALLAKLGYTIGPDDVSSAESVVKAPAGRKVVFLGDLADRGPRIPHVFRLAMGLARDGIALCLPGNHDNKLLRKLKGRNVQIKHGLAESLTQLAAEPPLLSEEIRRFLEDLPSHYMLDEGRLVVAHAGMKEELQGSESRAAYEFALYGETTGETDEFGLPKRLNWASSYRGRAMVVYGHTPVPAPAWQGKTINIDTGCVFGGRLTALRYPEANLVSVPAARAYAVPARPLQAARNGM